MRSTWARAARAIVVLVVAGVVFAFMVPQSKLERNRLGALVIAHSALSELPRHPVVSQSVPPSRSTFASIRDAAHKYPDDTGIYAREWSKNSQGGPEAGVILQLLPGGQQASAALAEVTKQLDKIPAFQGSTATSPENFAIPGLSGARGVSYLLEASGSSSKSPIGSVYTTVFRRGDVVVNELMATSSTVRDPAPVITDMRAGDALLAKELPGFSMVHTSVPFVSALIFVLVALALAAAAVFVPEWLVDAVHRRRERREAREHKKEREQYLARGRRTVRRQRAPAWSQSRRR